MHRWLRTISISVLLLLHLEGCLRKKLPPENYDITETVSKYPKKQVDSERGEAPFPPNGGDDHSAAASASR